MGRSQGCESGPLARCGASDERTNGQRSGQESGQRSGQMSGQRRPCLPPGAEPSSRTLRSIHRTISWFQRCRSGKQKNDSVTLAAARILGQANGEGRTFSFLSTLTGCRIPPLMTSEGTVYVRGRFGLNSFPLEKIC